MSFVSLGLVNVRRNLGRSILAIISMAIASLVVTSLLSLAPSAHTAEHLALRFLLGGDILVTSQPVVISAADIDPANGTPASWHLDRLPLDAGGLLAEAVPWPWAYGYLAVQGSSPPALSDLQIASIEQALQGQPKLAGIAPLSYLPVLERIEGQDEQPMGYVRSFLAGRNVARDGEWWGEYLAALVSRGTYLTDAGGTTVSADAVCDEARTQRGYPGTRAGGSLTLLLPQAIGPQDGSGFPGWDYASPTVAHFDVVGTLRSVTATELTEGGPVDYYWGSGAVLVAQATVDQLARQAGLDRAPVAGLAIKATDLVRLDELVVAVRAALPGFRVLSVRELVASLAWTGGVVPLVGEVSGAQAMFSLVPRGLPLDLNLIFAVLAFTIAAMIVAANLLVLLIERRREISILRSLGARTADIVVMVQTEVLVLSLAGCVLGFWPIRLLATITLLANRLSIGQIASLTLGDFGLVCGIALGLAALFGLLPAIASTRTTCMEALRND